MKSRKEIARNDLVKYRIPRWQTSALDRLSTDKPDISFGRDLLYIYEDVHGVSVTVSGPLEGHQNVAMVICRLGGVEYSVGDSIY